MNKHVRWIVPVALFGAGRAMAQDTVHELKLTPDNVTYGPIDGHTKPVIRVASGDTIAVETGGSGVLQGLRFAGVPDSELPAALKEVGDYGTAHGTTNSPTTGPIYVEGAEPGDILEVHFLKFEFINDYGWTQIAPGSGTLQKEFPEYRIKVLQTVHNALTSFMQRYELTPSSMPWLATMFWLSIDVRQNRNLENSEIWLPSLAVAPKNVRLY